MSDVASGSTSASTLCCTPYDSRLLGSARPELGAALGIYGAPYTATQSYPGYLTYGPEPPTLCGALVSNGAWDCSVNIGPWYRQSAQTSSTTTLSGSKLNETDNAKK